MEPASEKESFYCSFKKSFNIEINSVYSIFKKSLNVETDSVFRSFKKSYVMLKCIRNSYKLSNFFFSNKFLQKY